MSRKQSESDVTPKNPNASHHVDKQANVPGKPQTSQQTTRAMTKQRGTKLDINNARIRPHLTTRKHGSQESDTANDPKPEGSAQ